MGRKLPVVADFEVLSEPVERRVATGLHKLGLAMKQQAWSQAADEGLSPTQGQILSSLALEGPSTGSELAARLGVSLPTISDSAKALVDKGLVDKGKDPRHPRASLLSLTPPGRTLAAKVRDWPDFLAAAVETLADGERTVMLTAVVKMIRALQESGHVPVHRLCVTCRYFRPRVHEGERPHHCALVDAPMADRHLRVECPDHEPADADVAAATWARFVG